MFTNLRIAVIEDHEMFRMILARYCAAWGFSVVATADDGAAGLKQCLRLLPDLALIDVDLPSMSGLEVAAALHAQAPEVRLVIVTSEIDPEVVQAAIRIGVDGILDKATDSFERIGRVLPDIMDGRPYYSPSVIPYVEDSASVGRTA